MKEIDPNNGPVPMVKSKMMTVEFGRIYEMFVHTAQCNNGGESVTEIEMDEFERMALKIVKATWETGYFKTL